MCKTINIKGNLVELSTPIVMGILNITPDSFYPTSRKNEINDILHRVEDILSQGGTIIDIGAQSTRPTSKFLSVKEELERLEPALTAINKEFPQAILSIDTFYSDIAQCCVEKYNVAIINDISGGEIDKNMFDTISKLQTPYVLMHMHGTPQTMQKMSYYNNLIEDISLYFSGKIAKLRELGVNDIILDPGFGFAKDLDQNYELMSNLNFFQNFDLPLLIGVSRKSMACKLLDITSKEALNATTILNTYALINGAKILRVHDVKEALEAITIIEKLKEHSC